MLHRNRETNVLRLHTEFIVLIACVTLSATTARAAGEMGDADHKDEGASYFGFVKDASGKPIAEAKVTAEIKNGISYIIHTSKNGMYKFGGFNKKITPNDVTISCTKDGFRQVRVIRKTSARGKDKEIKSVETECRMKVG